MHGFGGSMGIGMGFGWIIWLVIIGVAIWAIIRLTNNTTQSTGSRTSNSKQDTPVDILKKRYARGEISEEEFEEMRNKL